MANDSIAIKICGLTTTQAVDAAIDAGAQYLGCVFFPPSPRNVSAANAAEITHGLPRHIRTVAVMVAPDDQMIDAILREFTPNLLQLHGHETPARVKDIRMRYGIPVIKALSIREADDIAPAYRYEEAADMLLFDAKPPKMPGALPGGNGLCFDWALLQGREFSLPWFLSGGLNISNVKHAVQLSGARMLDVSSSVESHPGVKEPLLIQAFCDAVKNIKV